MRWRVGRKSWRSKQQNKAQTFQQRWQQEMLRREAEQLQREMEQMQGQQGQQGQQGGQQSASGSFGTGKGWAREAESVTAGAREARKVARSLLPKDGGTDPRVQQALNRLRAANEAMRRAGGQPQNGQPQEGQQGSEQARRAAEHLREATNLLGGAQKEQASGKLDSLSREAGRLAKEEAAQADRIRSLGGRKQDENSEPTPGGDGRASAGAQ